jgi:hypothetical protein
MSPANLEWDRPFSWSFPSNCDLLSASLQPGRVRVSEGCPMNDEPINPVVLKSPFHKERTWVYPWVGIVFGVAVGSLIGHPLAMLAYNFHECLMSGTTCDVTGAIFHSFSSHMWPMMLLFSVFGGVSWGIIGFILKRLRENRLRLDTLHQEFEFQVATLRHHYKNLATGK